MSTTNFALPAIAAGAATTVDVFVVPGHGGENFAVGEANLVSRTAQAAQGTTNFCTLNLQYSRAGGAPVNLGSLSLGATALTVDVPVAFNLGANQGRAELQAGDVIQVAAVHTGTGGAVPASDIEIETE